MRASTSASLTRSGDEEISIGDYVLTGGELASLVVADSVLRLQPGVLAEEKGLSG